MTRHVKHFCSIATAFFARSLESVFARSRLLDRDCSKVFLLQGVFARSRLLENVFARSRLLEIIFARRRFCSKAIARKRLLEGVFARKRLLESDCSKVFLLEGARKHFCFDRDCSKVFLLDRRRLLESDCSIATAFFARSKAIAQKRFDFAREAIAQKVFTATDPVEIVI